MKSALGYVTASFAAGVFAASALKLPARFYCALLAALAALLPLLVKRRLDFRVLAAFWLILGAVRLLDTAVIARNHFSAYLEGRGARDYIVRGRVLGREFMPRQGNCYRLRVSQIGDQEKARLCSGELLACLGRPESLEFSETIILKGRLSELDGKMRPFSRQGPTGYVLEADKASRIVRETGASGVRGPAARLKKRLSGILSDNFSGVCAGVLKAMVLGDEKEVPAMLYRAMIRSGTVHVLVVSGFNVALVALSAEILLKALRFKRRLRWVAVLPVLVFYCFITGASPPVVRATIMATAFIISLILKRELQVFNSLSLAVLVMLLADPRQLFDIGFQLSFLSVLGIACAATRLLRLDWPAFFTRPLRFFAEVAVISFCAWAFTAPAVFYHFRAVSLIAVFANMLVVPLATLITLCGFAFLFLHLAHLSFFAAQLASCIEAAVFILARSVLLLANLPFAYLN